MKVLVVSSVPDRPQGGVEVIVRGLRDGLRELGIANALVTKGDKPAQLAAGHYVVPMFGLRTWHGIPTPHCIRDLLRSMVSVLAVLVRERPTVVHVHYLDYPLLYWVLLRRLFRFKLVLTGHGKEVTALVECERLRVVPDRLMVWLASRCDARTGVAPRLARELADLTRRGAEYVQNGIDVPFWSGGASPRASRTILGVGRLSPEKGWPVLLRAVALLKARGCGFDCIIAGDGELRSELERMADALGLSDVVSFTGRLGAPGLREHFGACTVLALSSLREGLPLVLLEAAAAGAPIVATKVGGIAEVFKHGTDALLVPENDADALADAIGKLLADEALRESLSRSARDTAAKHSTRAMTLQYVRIYRRLAGEGRAVVAMGRDSA